MFGAIAKLFRTIGYLFTGRVDAKRKELATDAYAIQANYDRIVREKKARIGQYRDAVARMVTQEEQKIARVKQLSEEVGKLEKLKEGAAAKARMVVNQLKGQGKDMAAIKTDPEYMRCLAAFNDFNSTLAEKQEHIAELEADLQDITKNVGHHKIQLQQLLREVEKIKGEASATVADVITAKEEQQVADMLAGISEDRTGRELEEMREMRAQAKAKARVSREIAGTDAAAEEREFMEYARTGVSSDEFDQLIGLADQTDTADSSEFDRAVSTRAAKLPE
jgi:predicted  nucleic acid-binding Zn-ribbon protein